MREREMSYKKIVNRFKESLKEITVYDVIDARYSGDKEKLNEASLGRAYQHFLKSKKESFGIITAWRSANTANVNKSHMENLKNTIRSQGMGFFKLRGAWLECTETDSGGNPVPYENCSKEKLRQVSEPSYFVTGCKKKDILRWAKRFQQDAGLYCGPESAGRIVIVRNDGTEIDLGAEFHANGISQAFSSIKGRGFFFEDIHYPTSFMEGMLIREYEKKFNNQGEKNG